MLTDLQAVEFWATRTAENAVAARVWNLLSERTINEETIFFVKVFIGHTLQFYGKNFGDLTPEQQQAAITYQFDVCSGTQPAPETLENIAGVYPPVA
jgi:hypothetical protein